MIRLLPLLLLATACAPAPARDQTPVMGGGACDAAPVQDLVGKPSGEALGADALARSGAKVMRWIRPGQVVTMEYREDRLNLHLDDKGVVARINCG